MYLDNLTGTELTANINPHEHGFASKMQTLIPVNINEFTVLFGTYKNTRCSLHII